MMTEQRKNQLFIAIILLVLAAIAAVIVGTFRGTIK